MVDTRENSLVAIENRIINNKIEIGLKAFYINSNILISKDNVPAIKIIEGNDNVKSDSKRGSSNYSTKRQLEIDVQVINKDINDKGKSIKNLFSIVKRSIFYVKNDENIYVYSNNLTNSSFINEIRTIGPLSYEASGLIGMVLVVGLNYIDRQIIN